jgi:hypothetical protein
MRDRGGPDATSAAAFGSGVLLERNAADGVRLISFHGAPVTDATR